MSAFLGALHNLTFALICWDVHLLEDCGILLTPLNASDHQTVKASAFIEVLTLTDKQLKKFLRFLQIGLIQIDWHRKTM